MEAFRVKIITKMESNIPLRPDENISVSDNIDILNRESVCDYNILIVNLPTLYTYESLHLDKDDFSEFLDKPSVILCISDKEDLPEKYSQYAWLPGKQGFKVINKTGESLKPTENSGRYIKLFNAYNWKWLCSFSIVPSQSPSYVSIANNITGQNVALMAGIGEGKVILIPIPKIDIKDPKKYSAFLRLLVDLCKEEIEELAEKESEEPDWVEKYVVPEELKLRDKISELQEQYQTLTEAHKLFYEMSKTLTKTVTFVLSSMGFNSEMKEYEGIHDVEICESDCDFVVEVTSSGKDWINITKTRQLLDWCRRYEQERGKKPKGVLIANPYCNYPLSERDEPFTPAALKHAEAEDFCLITSEQLYNIFCKFLKDEIDKDKIKELLLSTKGLLSFGE
ncbi:MAG: hypothetical protein KAV68_02650 [Dehalococcoidales bacterium]|nr:hypothetical protein [Dehalococcoidales bacterium]